MINIMIIRHWITSGNESISIAWWKYKVQVAQHIIIAAICLLPWYYVFNAEYPKEPRGYSKSMSGQVVKLCHCSRELHF